MDVEPAPAGLDGPTSDQARASTSPSRKRAVASAPPWRTIGIVVLVLLFAASGTALAAQQSRLHSTRSDLAALRSSLTTQSARVDAVEKSAKDQQQSLASVSAQLTTTKTELQSTKTQLQGAQTQLQGAETRLAADEQQLKLTTAQLPPNVATIATQVSPSVVLVTCTTLTTGGAGTGFAFALPAAKGFRTTVITAAHVVSDCADPTDGSVVALSTGAKNFDVHIRAIDTTNDVAILDTTATLPTLAPSGAPFVGESVVAVGNALGIVSNNVTAGNVSKVYDTYFLDTAPISNGNSGGPVVDGAGKVVGIVDAAQVPSLDTPIVENLNISLRLSILCAQLLSGTACNGLH
jgi:S1-C subfamily serine protease